MLVTKSLAYTVNMISIAFVVSLSLIIFSVIDFDIRASSGCLLCLFLSEISLRLKRCTLLVLLAADIGHLLLQARSF